MAYCSVQKVVSRGVSLAEVETTRVDEAILWAQSEIDGRLAGRYSVPFDPVPLQIQQVAADLAAYFTLHEETLSGGENKAVAGAEELYRRAEKTLEGIQNGSISLTFLTPPVDPDVAPACITVGHPSGEPSFPAMFDLVNVPEDYPYPPFSRRVQGYF